MALVDLAEGDIIVQSGADHCVMWVGGDQPLAHAVTGPGVIQQSDGYFRDVGRPVTLGDHTVWRLKVQSDDHKNLAEQAAGLASDWANNRQRGTNRPKTPFGTTRWLKTYLPEISDEQQKKDLTTKWNAAAEGFDEQSTYQILKMYTRALDRTNTIPLSATKGVSCSQFVIYCYQIASLAIFFDFGDPGEHIFKNPAGFKARQIQMGATETKDANALLAAEEVLTQYAQGLSKIEKFKSKKEAMKKSLGQVSQFTVHSALLPSLQTTTRFLTSEFLVEKFLPKSFGKIGFYLPYCGQDLATKPKIVQVPHKTKDRELTANTPFKVAHEKVFNETPG